VVVGGRYGLSSKEWSPAMAKAVLDEIGKERPRNHFTVGIVDDVTHTSLPVDPDSTSTPRSGSRALFFGLGADGTVGANKNSIKIIGEETDNDAQGYFVYDSKKSGADHHLPPAVRSGPIRSSYLVKRASFVACHQFGFLDRYDVLECAAPGAVVLLNSPYGPDQVWDRLPREVQEQILEKRLELYVIDALSVARDAGMSGRINSIMQTCFFAISRVLPRDEAIAKIKAAIEKTYGRKGEEVVRRNFAAVDQTLEHLHRVTIPAAVTATRRRPPLIADEAPDFVKKVEALMIAGKGDLLPVSAFPVDGTWPTATARWEKRAIAVDIPAWDPAICIQCNKCALVCPHAAIRTLAYPPLHLATAPASFKSTDYKGLEWKGWKYTVQTAPEDCTGCGLCVAVCPAKDKANPRHKAIDMNPMEPLRAQERQNYDFFLGLPEPDRRSMKIDLKGSQFLTPLFEYSGACAGCGETPYLKLMTQLFGDRTLIANATGCSSIYGGNLPTTPYTVNKDGRGPAWANSLFEDNAEFGFGMRLALDALRDQAIGLLGRLAPQLGDNLVKGLRGPTRAPRRGSTPSGTGVSALLAALAEVPGPEAARLRRIASHFVKKNVWIVGGDGWAYDIGYGGLDHVLASRRDVNVLVLDTEVYSNTGGQASKATPLGASAKFAVAGKEVGKKDLGLLAMSYGHVYVARVAFGAKDAQTVKAFQEAESYPGPSLIIAYSHCIAHGYDMAHGADQQKLAVDSGVWPLYRFDPRRVGGRPATAPPRLASREDLAPGVHAQRDPVPRGGAHGPGAVPDASGPGRAPGRPAVRGLPAARRHQGSPRAGRGPHPHARGRRVGATTMDLRTTYLGLELPPPLHARGHRPWWTTSTPCASSKTRVRPAIIMHSLFEEQIVREQVATFVHTESHGYSFAEALTYFPSPESFALGPTSTWTTSAASRPRWAVRSSLPSTGRPSADGSATRGSWRRRGPMPSS
jgi:pyruvate-ferredoxin/flavodoxin oxidoreductase